MWCLSTWRYTVISENACAETYKAERKCLKCWKCAALVKLYFLTFSMRLPSSFRKYISVCMNMSVFIMIDVPDNRVCPATKSSSTCAHHSSNSSCSSNDDCVDGKKCCTVECCSGSCRKECIKPVLPGEIFTQVAVSRGVANRTFRKVVTCVFVKTFFRSVPHIHFAHMFWLFSY